MEENLKSQNMIFQDMLTYIEQQLGATPRKFSIFDRMSWLKLHEPSWNWADDDIRYTIENWNDIFKNGRLAWAHIIQVNKLMFAAGDTNCPGEIVVWCDKSEIFDLSILAEIAHNLYELKGHSEELVNVDEKFFAQYLENQKIRVYGLKVPTSLSRGVNARVSTIFFQRKHIPGRKITYSFFPVLYLQRPTMAVAMVPYKFWPENLYKHWLEI